ncbi:MAG: hypothetical protein IPN16_23975 [Gemmatimonadetes bacterium]|nr:hypothetical protein [Gemmatimonadota bacterium]
MRLRLVSRLSVSLLASLLAANTARAQQFGLEHYAKVARVSDVQVSPLGDRAVIVLAWPNYDANAWESEIVQVDLTTRARVTSPSARPPARHAGRRRAIGSPSWQPLTVGRSSSSSQRAVARRDR